MVSSDVGKLERCQDICIYSGPSFVDVGIAGHGNTNKAFLGIHVGSLWCASWSITLAGNDRWVGFRSMWLGVC